MLSGLRRLAGGAHCGGAASALARRAPSGAAGLLAPAVRGLASRADGFGTSSVSAARQRVFGQQPNHGEGGKEYFKAFNQFKSRGFIGQKVKSPQIHTGSWTARKPCMQRSAAIALGRDRAPSACLSQSLSPVCSHLTHSFPFVTIPFVSPQFVSLLTAPRCARRSWTITRTG